MGDHKADQELDTRGLNCPLPVLKTKKKIDTMESGKVLKVISSDAGSVSDMAAWARRTGNELLESTVEGSDYVFFFRRK